MNSTLSAEENETIIMEKLDSVIKFLQWERVDRFEDAEFIPYQFLSLQEKFKMAGALSILINDKRLEEGKEPYKIYV